MNNLKIYSMKKYIVFCVFGAVLIAISMMTSIFYFIPVWIAIELYGLYGLSKFCNNKDIFNSYFWSYIYLLTPIVFLYIINNSGDTSFDLFDNSVVNIMFFLLVCTLSTIAIYYRYKSLKLISDEFSNILFVILAFMFPIVIITYPIENIRIYAISVYILLLIISYIQTFFSIKQKNYEN